MVFDVVNAVTGPAADLSTCATHKRPIDNAGCANTANYRGAQFFSIIKN